MPIQIDYARGENGETWMFRQGNFSAEVNRHAPSGANNVNIQCSSTIYMSPADAQEISDAFSLLVDIANTSEYVHPIREDGESLRDLATRVAMQLYDLTISASHRRLLEWNLARIRKSLDEQGK